MQERLVAYTLLGDPHYLAASIASYYEVVDAIVISYDRNGLSWVGEPLAIDACLDEVRAVDRQGKAVFAPGDFAFPDQHPLISDTWQRNAALSVASELGDWVLQLDGDEILPDPGTLLAHLERADSSGASALDFPSLWLFQQYAQGRYLASTDRWGRLASGFPGPLAVRAGTTLEHCRQTSALTWRVDIAPSSRDPFQPWSPVHSTVPWRSAVRHFSWVRPREEMERKSRFSGHRDDLDWGRALRRWDTAQRHPYVYSAASPFRRRALTSPGAQVRPIRLTPVSPFHGSTPSEPNQGTRHQSTLESS